MHDISWTFSNLLQAASGMLISLNYATHLSNNFDNVFSKKRYRCSCSYGIELKGTGWVLRIFPFNNKSHYIGH